MQKICSMVPASIFHMANQSQDVGTWPWLQSERTCPMWDLSLRQPMSGAYLSLSVKRLCCCFWWLLGHSFDRPLGNFGLPGNAGLLSFKKNANMFFIQCCSAGALWPALQPWIGQIDKGCKSPQEWGWLICYLVIYDLDSWCDHLYQWSHLKPA